MKAYDKEFFELMNQFEKDMKTTAYSLRFDRVKSEDRNKVPKDQFYDNGQVNQLFHAYMMGYAYRSCLANLGY